MRQTLQLRTSQQLAMTPQLQQAIRMLQLSSLELQIEIQQALDSNVMLEDGSLDEDIEDTRPENSTESDNDSIFDSSAEEKPVSAEQEIASESGMLEKTADIPDELPVDSSWDDIYDAPVTTTAAAPPGEGSRDFEQGDSSSESLQQHLIWQMRMANLSEEDIEIAETLIDAIDSDGFISSPLEELLEGLQRQGLEIDIEELNAVLHTIQNFDPPGVAACSLQESLLLQLKVLASGKGAEIEGDEMGPGLIAQTVHLLENHFNLLASRDYAQLKRKLHLNDEQLHQLTHLIQSLNPRPGSQFSAEKPQYIVPDVFVTKRRDSWKVELNMESAPKIRINSSYAGLIKQMSGSDSSTLKSHLQEARWFIKSLQSRNETLMKVATSIVEHQQGFLEEGEVAMKAMVLADIASELGMHESTISRTTTRKYMHTPRGIFELKYFFSSHVSTSGGGECSSTAIRAMIKKLISEEPAKKPLSDNKIATMLAEQGINVARRTIAKYRESMAIPPSNERKRLA